jgi:glutamate-1-semialdehyde 2,1-aminomutase
VIRLARALTGRDVVLVFDGKYHGEGDTTLVIADEDGEVVAEQPGLPPWVAEGARIVPFNDIAALEAALAPRDVALVLAEPAMTNAGFILPRPVFHSALRRATRETGTLLGLDEVHTLVCAHAGLAGEWGLEPDFLSVGKSIAAGVPLAAYGMREEVAAVIAPPTQARVVSGAFVDEVPTGGTLFANALSMRRAGRRSSGSSPRRRSPTPLSWVIGWRWDCGRRSPLRASAGVSRATAPTPATSSLPNHRPTARPRARSTILRCGR